MEGKGLHQGTMDENNKSSCIVVTDQPGPQVIDTFLMASDLAASWKPIMLSGVQILRNGKSEFLAIVAARAVLPLLGGPG